MASSEPARWQERCEALLATGAEQYRAGDHERALADFLEAATLAAPAAASAEGRILAGRAGANAAQCALKLREFAKAEEAAAGALEALRRGPPPGAAGGAAAEKLKALTVKALIRRCLAREGLGNFEQALRDAEAALDEGLFTGAALSLEAVKARDRLRRLAALDDGAAQADTVPERFVHGDQTLRLNIVGSEFSEAIVVDGDAPVVRGTLALAACNEFGLWARADRGSIGANVLITASGEGAALRPAAGGAADAVDGRTLRAPLDAKGRCSVPLELSLGGAVAFLAAEMEEPGARAVLPVCTMPILRSARAPAAAALLRSAAAVQARQCRPIAAAPSGGGSGGGEILAAEAPGRLGIAGKVWDAALAAKRWLSAGGRAERWVVGKKVVEVGSGTGILGLYATALFDLEMMVMTDLPEAVALMEANVALNRLAGRLGEAAAQRLRCRPLPWGDEAAAAAVAETLGGVSEIDLVIASDCVYEPDGYAPLVQTLCSLCVCGGADALIAYRHRNPESHRFFAMLRERFAVEELEGLGPRDAAEGAADVVFLLARRRGADEGRGKVAGGEGTSPSVKIQR